MVKEDWSTEYIWIASKFAPSETVHLQDIFVCKFWK